MNNEKGFDLGGRMIAAFKTVELVRKDGGTFGIHAPVAMTEQLDVEEITYIRGSILDAIGMVCTDGEIACCWKSYLATRQIRGETKK